MLSCFNGHINSSSWSTMVIMKGPDFRNKTMIALVADAVTNLPSMPYSKPFVPHFYLHVTIHFVCTVRLLKMPSLCGNKSAFRFE